MNNKSKIIAIILGVIGLILILLFFLFGTKEKNYTVSFDTDGGSYISSVVVKEGERVVKPTNPTKNGYVFARWNYNNVEYDFSTSVTSDMTLKAVWAEEEKPKYKVTLKVNGKEEVLDLETLDESSLDNLPFEEKSGYALEWYVNGVKYDFSSPLTSDVTLEGKYVKVNTYTVKFNSDGGSKVNNQTIKTGEKVKEPENPTKEAFIFDGWYLNNKKYDFASEVTKNITLVAKWKEDPNVERYTVKFDSDGGSKVADQRVIENKLVKEPTAPTKDNQMFVEWQLDNKKYDFNTKVTKDITLKAKWRDLEKVTVIFANDDGSVYLTSSVLEGNTISKPADPVKNGYTFKEWQLNNKAFDFKTKIMQSITLKATFTKDPVKYTVTFNSNGGTNVASQTVTEGGKATKPANPTKENNTFIGWFNGETEYNFNNPVNSNITLTAKWEEVVTYTVTFDTKGGTTVASQKIEKGKTATRPTNPTKSDNTFKNWLLNGNPYDFSSAVNSDITLTADWEEKVYKISSECVSNTTCVDVTLTVWDGNNKVNAKDVLLNGTSMGFTWNKVLYERTSEFTVELQNGTRARAIKK